MAFAAMRAAALAARIASRGARFARPTVRTWSKIADTKRKLSYLGYARKRLIDAPETGSYKRPRFTRAGSLAEAEGLSGGVGGTYRSRKQWIPPAKRKRYWRRMRRIGRKYIFANRWEHNIALESSDPVDKSWLAWGFEIPDKSADIVNTIELPTPGTEIRQKVRMTGVSCMVKLINPYSWAMKFKLWMGYCKQNTNDVRAELASVQPDGNGWNRYNTLSLAKVYRTAFAVVPAGNTKSITISLPLGRTIDIAKGGATVGYDENPFVAIVGYPEFGSEHLTTPTAAGMNFKTGKANLSGLKYAMPHLDKYFYIVPSQFNVKPAQMVIPFDDTYSLTKVDVDASEKQEPADW